MLLFLEKIEQRPGKIINLKAIAYWLLLKEFRFQILNQYPTILEAYYQVGETIDPANKIRDYDHMIWSQDAKNSWEKVIKVKNPHQSMIK